MRGEDFNFEIQRKVFHLYGLIFPVIYCFTSRASMSILLAIITGLTLYFDRSRRYNEKINSFVQRIFSKYLRPKEKQDTRSMTGASYMALGLFITCLFFSKGLAIVSWMVLIISDCMAAIIGIKYGSSLPNGKSLAGSTAFFASGIFTSIVVYFFVSFQTSFLTILLSSAAATAAEFYASQLKINDNLSIPLSYCFTTVALNLIL